MFAGGPSVSACVLGLRAVASTGLPSSSIHTVK